MHILQCALKSLATIKHYTTFANEIRIFDNKHYTTLANTYDAATVTIVNVYIILICVFYLHNVCLFFNSAQLF